MLNKQVMPPDEGHKKRWTSTVIRENDDAVGALASEASRKSGNT